MKIYLLITNSRIDGGDENINVEPFEQEVHVRKAFEGAVARDKKEAEKLGWETEQSDNSYESFEPGYEMENHNAISIKEVELKGYRRVRTVYGADLIKELKSTDESKLTVKNAEKQCPSIYNLCERTFDTQAELDAYEQGRWDQDGWDHYDDGSDHPEIPDDVWAKFGKQS